MPAALELTNKRFGRLVALRRGELEGGRYKWIFQCDCGRLKAINTNDVRMGKTTSCGCLHSDVLSEQNTKHGLTGSAEHRSWISMVQRCTDLSNPYYGGRGITICERWKEFKNFLADMGTKPTPDHTLDRINNNGNYEPTNCRWATKSEQRQNQG